MALRDQPYIPLYVQDIMTDEKLNECCAATHGVYIKGIMCLMHKSSEYGKILLKQKYKQNQDVCLNFANQLAKHLPYEVSIIQEALKELLAEGVLKMEGDFIVQQRMVNDNKLSQIRATAGKMSVEARNFAKANNLTNPPANTEYEDEYENEAEIGKIKKVLKNKEGFNSMPVIADFNGLPQQYLDSSKELVFRLHNKLKIEDADVIALWEAFKVQHLTGENWYANEGKVYSHFINVIKKEKFNNGTGNSKDSAKLSPSAARNEARRNY